MVVLKKALFIDRDGTIIKDIPYSADAGRIEIYHDAVDLMKRYSGEGYLIVIVTNQSGINRRYQRLNSHSLCSCFMSMNFIPSLSARPPSISSLSPAITEFFMSILR